MSPEKKQSSKKHFLEMESGFKRLLNESSKDVPSKETLNIIRDYHIQSGDVDSSSLAFDIPGTSGYYLNFILKAEQKSEIQVAKELDVSPQDVKLLKTNLDPMTDQSLFEFCNDFVKDHSQFALRPLFTLLKRAIVLHSMSSGETLIRKAARKKPQK
jgi:hypothetical protein